MTITFHAGGAAKQGALIDEACRAAGRDPATLYRSALTVGCVLAEGEAADSDRAVAQAGPGAAITFHNLMEAPGAPPAWLAEPVAAYRRMYEGYEPESARHMALHTGHMVFVRPDERPFITGELIRRATFTGTQEELRDRVRAVEAAGFNQVIFQLVPGQEAALRDWAEVAELA